jgi:amidophosphoribosyltransferase
MDKPQDECGVFGIYSKKNNGATLSYYGLYALQHRGQESAGIATSNGKNMKLYKNLGLVSEVFDEEKLAGLSGHLAVGHVRYSTTGSSSIENAQPLMFNYLQGRVALAHNGNLTNANELRYSLATTGSVFQSTSDTEVIINLIARYGQSPIEEALMKCMIDLKGAYSLVVMTENKLLGVRDPLGIRPLCLGKCKDGSYVLASESCALDTINAQFIRDIEPGEIVVIDEKGVKTIHNMASKEKALCVFELVYLARPDSVMDGEAVISVRKEMGRQMAKEYQVEADLVVPVPDSGNAAAVGYAEASGIPFVEALMKNRYVGRTFIQPDQKLRDIGVRLKLNPMGHLLKDKRIILVDDSIVRGTTSKKIVAMLREVGVKEIHMLITSPPILFPCFYGIDTSSKEELIATKHNLDEICQYIGADSLHYISLDGLLSSMTKGPEDFCVACFNGQYKVEIPKNGDGKYALEKR